MRISPLRPTDARNRRGVALIIVLAFVVLLTGVVVAFFSRSLSERQISNSSAAQVKVDLFAQGAVATITDDLKQEIAAGSNTTYYTYTDPTTQAKTVYPVFQPINPTAAAPALALKGQQSAVTTFAANLVKRSAYGQNFFPDGNDAGSTNYNNGNTTATVVLPSAAGATPSPVAATKRSAPNRAANVSTTTASLNGRSISTARWNKPLLLPKSSAVLSDSTKSDPAPTLFAAPDWILVARDGTNPGSPNVTPLYGGNQTGSVTNPAVANPAPINAGYVTGRYAYTIYDEGGLLDANVAGYPTDPAAYPSVGVGSLPPTPIYKAALAYADLTIPVPADATAPTGSTQPLLTGAQVNTLVGWRNYASAQTVGTFPTYTAKPTPPGTPKNLSLFDRATLYNTNGFLGVGTNPSNYALFNGQSDRMFGTRQELINFFSQSLTAGPADKVTLASLQNSLQYFGTTSRSLSQPSYVPVSRAASPTSTNPNPRPLIQPSGPLGSQLGGGNNVGDNYTTGAQQDTINPQFLTVRAQAAFTRNDAATSAVIGEPLVKRRFALQRLAWLTYNGPSANNMSDANVQKLITDYGYTTDYLQKGTVANIQRYFGLNWDTKNRCWQYNIHNVSSTSSSSVSKPIMKLQDIADAKLREPDFFELLKAAVDAGALGKASTNAAQAELTEPGPGTHFNPLNFQFFHDVSVDAAIIQLGANIIDQFDLDGYPTRIVFDDGSGAREIHGVENLPYIYRIRTGSVKVRDSIPGAQVVLNGAGSAQTPYLHSGTMAGYTANPLMDTGAGLIMAVPDIWNPHDQNSSLGSPRPGTNTGSIRLVANSAMPDTVYTDTVNNTPNIGYSTYTSGGFSLTDQAHGTYRGTSIANAVTPDVTAKPPIPYFTRGANATGTLAVPALIVGGSPLTTNGGYAYSHYINTTNATYLTLKVPDERFFREPTMLGLADPSSVSTGLTMVVDSGDADILNLQNSAGAKVYFPTAPTYGIKSLNPNPLGIPGVTAATQGYIGIVLGVYPLRWVGPRWSGSASGTLWNYPDSSLADAGNPVYAITYSMQYQDPVTSVWITYDDKYVDSDLAFVDPFQGQLVQPKGGEYSFGDPRTPRFGSGTETNIADAAHYRAPLTNSPPSNWGTTWLDSSGKLLSIVTERPDISSGFGVNFRGVPGASGDWGAYAALGLHTQGIDTPAGVNGIFFQTGMFAQNDPNFGSDGFRFVGDTGVGLRDGNFWSDPDGVVRRAVGAYVKTNATGQPLATATTISGGIGTPILSGQSQSRPIILNRPFRTVGELGYVYSGNPWKNIDFSTPESGYSELLDVFCVNDTAPSDGLVAGTVDLNTRQSSVLQSVLTGAYTDEENTNPAVSKPTPLKPLTATDADAIAKLLVARTSVASPSNAVVTGNTPQPLQNVGDLVGRWYKKQAITATLTTPQSAAHNIDGGKSYDGFSADLTNLGSGNLVSLSKETLKIPRLRESAVRALSSVGNTRVWNLMIDVIAQSGRFPPTANALNGFVVEGEQRYWVHLAIDRYTGTVLDTKLEMVKE